LTDGTTHSEIQERRECDSDQLTALDDPRTDSVTRLERDIQPIASSETHKTIDSVL
jgi:hypothetical protein